MLGAAVALIGGAFLVQARLTGGGGEPPATTANGCAPGVACEEGRGLSYTGDVAPPRITARSAVVIEADCGTQLYALNARDRRPPASLTKMMTALVAAERASMTQLVDVRVNSALLVASTASTVMGLEPGTQLSMRDLLHGLLLASGNDAAIAIAEAVAGNESAFVELMNAKARELGLWDTHFGNPHGLDQADLYSSALDMAMLGRALLARPELAAVVRTTEYQPAWDGPELHNGNELLELYPDAVGVKIGYTERAGQTIVAAAEFEGRRLIVSVLGAWDRYADAVGLFEWAFASTKPAC